MENEAARISRALSGDREAFEALVAAYWPVAERVARGLLSDAQLAQDIAQDVFADIYMQRARYELRFPFHAYVAAVARYKSISLLRKRRRNEALWDSQEESSHERLPEDAFVEAMFRGTLYAAVERLPEVQRRALIAYALEERSYREIADELGMSLAQVKITLHRVRKALRRVRDDWDA